MRSYVIPFLNLDVLTIYLGFKSKRVLRVPLQMSCVLEVKWLPLVTLCAFLLFFLPCVRFNVTCRYGSSANLVLSTGSGVNGYTLDAALGEFILTHPNASVLPVQCFSIKLVYE